MTEINNFPSSMSSDVEAPSSIYVSVLNYFPLSSPRTLSTNEVSDDLEFSSTISYCPREGDEDKYEIAISSEPHSYIPALCRTVFACLSESVCSIRSSTRGRIFRESIFPLKVEGCGSSLLERFLSDLVNMDFQIDLAEISLGEGCEVWEHIAFRTPYSAFLRRSYRALVVDPNFVNHGKTHRNSVNQDPEHATRLRSCMSRIAQIETELCALEESLSSLSGDKRDKVIGKILVMNERYRRIIASTKRTVLEIYPHIDLRPRAVTKYENHARVCDVFTENVLEEALSHFPALLGIVGQGVSILHHASKCSSRSDYLIFTLGLLSRFVASKEALDDLCIFVVDMGQEVVEMSQDEFINHASEVVEVGFFQTIVTMFAEQWDFVKRLLAVLVCAALCDAKEKSALLPGLARSAVSWIGGFAADSKDLPKLVFDLLKEMSERVYRVIISGNLSDFFTAQPTLVKRVLEFVNRSTSFLTDVSVMEDAILPMDLPEVLGEGESLIEILNHKIGDTSSSADGMMARGYYINALNQVYNAYRELQHLNRRRGRRRMPFAVCVFGPAGTGKSEAFPAIFAQLMPIITDTEYSPNLVGPLNPTEAFHSAVTSSHLGITIDDMGQCPDNEGKAQKVVFDICSSVDFMFTKAEVKEKGKVPCNAQLVLVSSNDINMGAAGVVKSLSAFTRRFVFVNFKLRKECVEKVVKNGKVESTGTFYANPDFLNDYWLVSVMLRRPAPATGDVWDPHAIDETYYVTSGGVEMKDVSLKQALVGLSELAQKHRKNQDLVEASNKDKSMTTRCQTCGCLKAFCECVNENHGGFISSSRRSARRVRRRPIVEKDLAVEAIEFPWYDRMWYYIPGVSSFEGFMRNKLIGSNDAFESMSTKMRRAGISLSLFSLSVSGPGLISTIAGISCVGLCRVLKHVNYLKDVSRPAPSDKKAQDKLVRRTTQFFALGSVLLTFYVLYKSIAAFMRCTSGESTEPINETQPSSVSKVQPLPKVDIEKPENHNIELALSGSESEGEVPQVYKPHVNAWRPLTDHRSVRDVTGSDLTIDFRVVNKRLADSVCIVTTFENEKPLLSVCGVVLQSNVLLVNNHVLQRGGNKIKVTFGGGNAACSTKTSPLAPHLWHTLEDPNGAYKDLALVNILSMPAIRDITDYLSEGLPHECPAVMVRYSQDCVVKKDKTFARIGFLTQPYLKHDGSQGVSEMTVYQYETPTPSAPGDCGSLLLTANASPRILGLHACGKGNESIACALTKNDFIKGLEQLRMKCPMFNHGMNMQLSFLPQDSAENEKSFVHRLKTDNGSCPLNPIAVPIVRPKFLTGRYGLEEYFNVGTKNYDAPAKEPAWLRPMAVLEIAGDPSKCDTDIDSLVWSTEDFLHTVFERMPEGFLDDVRFLTLDEVLNGVPELSLPALDISKSAGITLGKKGGPKSKYVEVDEETGRKKLCHELQVEFDKIEKILRSDDQQLVAFVFDMFAKDEARALKEDGRKKPYRPIFCGSFLSLLFESMILKPLFARIAAQPFIFETAMGLNAQRDWNAMCEYLHLKLRKDEVPLNKGVFGDWVHFDQSKSNAEKCSEVYITGCLLGKSKKLDQSQLWFARKVMLSVAFSPANFNSELVFVEMGWSGQFATFIHNCWSCGTRIRRVWHKKYPNEPYGEFGKCVKIVTGGDDHAVNNLTDKTVGMIDLYEYHKVLGVGYTDPQKNVPTQQFMLDSELGFFKRGAVLCEDLGVNLDFVTAPLELDSIRKTLLVGNRAIREGEGSPAQKELYMQSAMGCLMESLLHGKETYESVRNSLYKLFVEWGVEDWVRDDEFEPYDIRSVRYLGRLLEESRERGLMVSF